MSADLMGYEQPIGVPATPSGGTGITGIGDAVSGGTTGSILFVDAAGKLAQGALTFAGGTLSTTALQATGLTATRIPVAGASGLLGDFAGLTFAAASGITVSADDAVTAASTVLHTLAHTSSGTAAAGFGSGVLLKAESAGGTLRSCVQLDAVWSTATDAAEVSSLALSTMLAGTLTQAVRFGTGATLPDADFAMSMGRALMDSRATDSVYLSHRDMTTTSNYGFLQTAAGQTRLNCATGQTCGLYANNGTKLLVNTTGISFLAVATPVAAQTSGANLTNNVTAGGTDDTIANYTDLSVYANDAAAIRNDIYQLARKVKQLNDGLRAFGLFT